MLKPYLFATMNDYRFHTEIGVATRLVETINKEYEGRIGVRMTPFDPTSYKEVDVSQLKDVYSPKLLHFSHHAIVTGKGCFPDDMLRYSNCQVDVLSDKTFEENLTIYGDYYFKKETSVYLVQINLDKKPFWCEDRWASFGWYLKKIEK